MGEPRHQQYPRKLTPNTGEETVSFQTINGEVLTFTNRPGEYGVNRDQSLVLATAACLEAIRCALEESVPLPTMRALDVCCGAGPAALALKTLGVGYVEASDVTDVAVTRCKVHASQNDIVLDRIVRNDLLGDSVDAKLRFHVIVSNPPCAPSRSVDHQMPEQLQTAIDGGKSGAELTVRLIRSARDYLYEGGRLVVMVPSTIAFADVVGALGESFGQAWRMAACSPTASKYCLSDDPFAKDLLEERRRGSVFVWKGDDGWLWRLSWILVATRGASAKPGAGLCYAPYGMRNLDDDYWRAMKERGLSRSNLFEPAVRK